MGAGILAVWPLERAFYDGIVNLFLALFVLLSEPSFEERFLAV
jgi:hypothetical protein